MDNLLIENKHPLVSVGIPTYNRPKGLKGYLNKSNQTYKNIEIIVSDNCSENEKVKEVALTFAETDKRIKYINQRNNIGIFENFRFVLKESTGDYFMWASDDDEFLPTFIEKCLDKLIQDDNIVLCTPICKVVQDGNEIMKYKPDFNTVGLDKISRIKKIAFYIKKSHGA